MSSLESVARAARPDAVDDAALVRPLVAPRRGSGWPLACAAVDVTMLVFAAGATALGGEVSGTRNPSIGWTIVFEIGRAHV